MTEVLRSNSPLMSEALCSNSFLIAEVLCSIAFRKPFPFAWMANQRFLESAKGCFAEKKKYNDREKEVVILLLRSLCSEGMQICLLKQSVKTGPCNLLHQI
jgi:hypothetical protein